MLNRTGGAVRHVSVLMVVMAMFAFALAPWAGTPRRVSAQPLDTVVLDWNLEAVNTFLSGPTAPTPGVGQAPQVAILHIAMVQGAIYDAVNMIDGGYQPYLTGLPAADASASKAAAAAMAAHHVMVGVVIVPPLPPAIVDRIDMHLADSLAAATSVDGPEAVATGTAAGEAAAAAMLANRANDGRYVPFSFTSGTEPGEWRPAPPTNASDPFAWVARVDPFLLESTSQFRTKGPHKLKSGIYAKEYNEVKTLGGPTLGSPRSAEQEAIAQFYTANPIEMFNRTFRTIAVSEALTIVEQARLFAMLNMAVADALINTWDDKAHWSFWRPITAIHHGDDDGNRKTVGDPTWTPLIGTPPYPEHPSGYNAVSSAFMYTAEAFFGTKKMDFSVVKITPGMPNVTRDYERFRDVVDDTIDARIYQGLHFRAAEVQAAGIGKNVARWLDKHYFQPVH